MAWLTTYGASNQIIDEKRSDVENLTFVLPGSTTIWQRTITITKGRYVGMTYATAVTCQAAIDNPTGSPSVIATVKRENQAGAYMVEYTSTDKTTWTVI